MRSAILVVCLAACSSTEPSKPVAPRPAAPPPAVPSGPPPQIDAAIARSKAEHKPLVVEFFTTWCKPCKLFEHSLDDPQVRAAAARAIFVRYDAEAAGAGTEAAQRFKIASFPTFLAVDDDGTVRATQTGLEGDGIAQFVAFVASAEVATLDEADVRARIAADPHDTGALLAAAHWFADRGKTSDALAQYDTIAKEPSASDAQRGEARSAGMRLRRVTTWKSQLVAEKLELARTAPGSISEHDLVIATVDSGAAPGDVRDAIAKVLAAHGDAQSLNGLLYVALAAGATDEALAAAKRVLAASQDPSIMDTLAECYHVHGDHADALRVEDAAIKLADQATAAQLAPNRARFAAGTGGSDEVARLHAEAAALTKHLADIDRPDLAAASAPTDATDATGGADATDSTGATGATGGPPDVEAMQKAAMGAFMAARQLGASVAAACKSAAGKSQSAFARIVLDADGKVTSSTVFTDATATDALRTCITKQLAGATLPIVPGMPPQPIEITFVPVDH